MVRSTARDNTITVSVSTDNGGIVDEPGDADAAATQR